MAVSPEGACSCDAPERRGRRAALRRGSLWGGGELQKSDSSMRDVRRVGGVHNRDAATCGGLGRDRESR